jgi:hypothetical protein
MKLRLFLMTLAILGWAVGAQADLLHYNAAADFSSSANGSGAWSYGYTTTGDQVYFTPYNHSADLLGDGSIMGWCIGDSGWGDPNVNKNTTASEVNLADVIFWPAEALAAGSDINWTYATVVRWTCQEAGTYNIDASFTGIQVNNGEDYWLLSRDANNNGYSWIGVAWGDGGYGETGTYSGQMTFTAGETMDFVVYGTMQTAISAKIDQIPEPSTLVLLGCGLIGIVAYARKKR